MSDRYSISQEGDITIIRLYNGITLTAICDIWDLVMSKYPSRKRLWDLSSFQADFSNDDLIKFADYGRQSLSHRTCAAMVAPTDLLFGEMRQYKAYRERDENISVGVFRTTDEAMDWLSSIDLNN